MRKWESVVSISKARIYAPSFAPPLELKTCFVSFFSWNNLLTFYRHPNSCKGPGLKASSLVRFVVGLKPHASTGVGCAFGAA